MYICFQKVLFLGHWQQHWTVEKALSSQLFWTLFFLPVKKDINKHCPSVSHRVLRLNRKVNVDILLHILGTILITFWKWSGKRNFQFEKYSIWHNSNTVVCRVEQTSYFFLCFLVTSVLLNVSELVFSLVKWKLFS